MPHSPLEVLPSAASRGWPSAEGSFKAAHWGDMEVRFATADGPLDCTELYKVGGYPGSVCQCSHYFYVLEGSLRSRWPGSALAEEVVSAGQVCFFAAGHVLIYDEASRIPEWNPSAALQDCMAVVERAAQR